MMRGRTRAVHLIVGGLATHKKAHVKEYIASTKGKLTMHVLPGYAPELQQVLRCTFDTQADERLTGGDKRYWHDQPAER